MRTYLLYLWDTLRSSYWVLPSLCAIGAFILAVLAPYADERLAAADWDWLQWARMSQDTVRTTLATISGAMFAATGTVFSITVVTLSLTSQQFGPRLLRRFMNDHTTQYTFGVFVATAFYSLAALPSADNHPDTARAFHSSAIVGIGLALTSLIFLIVFIEHVITVIQAPHLVASVGADLDDAIERLFPPVEEGQQRRAASSAEPAAFTPHAAHSQVSIPAKSEGYLQAVNEERLIELATEHDLVVEVHVSPGAFVIKNAPVVTIHARKQDSGLPTETVLAKAVDKAIITGIRRTPRQDVESVINELVEVAVRSLSPGINDPFTATNCIDRLSASLSRVVERPAPESYRCDENGIVRISRKPGNFATLLAAAIDPIRQNVGGQVAVTLRLLEALQTIASRTGNTQDQQVVLEHAILVAGETEHLPEQADRDAVARQLAKVREIVGHS